MDREKLVERLKTSIEAVDELKKLLVSHATGFYSTEEKIKKINFLQESGKKLSAYLWKLENNILEVAFVGLEKAGKSTFINAFIGNQMLPTADKRATYITTQVKYSEKGKVIVRFYTEEEFLDKVFRKLLKDVQYPEAEIQNLDTVSVDDFKKYFEALREKSPILYEKHKNRLERDILEILEGKEEIKKYLIGGEKEFDENLMNEYKPFITDPFKSRAVKEAIIYSPKLEGLRNVIIYDLPGFDSPTFTHSEYTIDKIKKADAVVFIRLAKRPSLTHPEVEIITKTYEEDGLPLKEKTFFFAGMADYFDSREELLANKEELIRELKKYDLFVSENRIFFGSALAHLEKLKVVSGSKLSKLEELGISTGIDELKDRLIKYNKQERSRVLERRINHLIDEVTNFINDIKKDLKKMLDERDISNFKAKAVLEIRRTSVGYIEEKIDELLSSVKQEILEKEKLSNNLRKSVSSMSLMPSEDELNRIKKSIESTVTTNTELPDAFNREIRNKIRHKVRKDFTDLTEGTVREELERFVQKAEDIVLSALSSNGAKKDELKKKVSAFLNEKLQKFAQRDSGFKLIIDRFSGDVIEILTLPLSSQDRLNKFKSAEREIYSLAAYSKYYDPQKPPQNLPFIRKLLLQEDSEELKEQIAKLFKNAGKSLPVSSIEDFVSLALEKDSPLSILQKLSETLEFIDSESDLFNLYQKRKSARSLFEKRKELVPPSSYKEVINEVEKDIKSLKEIIKDAVVRAISLEKAFVVSIAKYVEYLKEIVNSEDFDEFILENFSLIRYDEYSKLIKTQTLNSEIRRTLETLERLSEKIS